MNLEIFYQSWTVDKSAAEELHFNPYYYMIETGLTDPVRIGGSNMINLASNNYLGLAADRRVKQAMIEAINKYGSSLCGTPIATGYTDSLKALEDRLSKWLGLEATVIFPSCYQANGSLFLAIAGKEDLVLVDHYAHASLIQGIKSSGVKIKPFLHNNMPHLEKLLASAQGYRRIFVVTESVFSTEGSIAPFDQVLNICSKYQAMPVVDDSHGIGVLGKRGTGILEEKGISGYPGIYTASLGKSLACAGGIISGKKELIEYLRYSCSGLIYSTAIQPSTIAGVLQVIGIIEKEFPQRSERMWKYKKWITNGLNDSGWDVTEGPAPITSVNGGSLEKTIGLSKDLFQEGILTTPFVPPSVSPGMGKVRLIAGANLTETTIEKALEGFRKIGRKKGWI